MNLAERERTIEFSVHVPGRFGWYASITHGVSNVTPGISAFTEKRLRRKALKLAARLAKRNRQHYYTVRFVEFPGTEFIEQIEVGS